MCVFVCVYVRCGFVRELRCLILRCFLVFTGTALNLIFQNDIVAILCYSVCQLHFFFNAFEIIYYEMSPSCHIKPFDLNV